MALTDYTSFAEVRAVLGVSEDEITDATLGLPIYDFALSETYSDISDLLLPALDASKAVPTAARTPAQIKLLRVANLYTAYSLAHTLLTSLPMFSYSRVTDGKAEVQRIDKWEDLREGVAANLGELKPKLRSALAAVDSNYLLAAATPTPIMTSTSILFDPVLGV
jgi:hypothetical protein